MLSPARCFLHRHVRLASTNAPRKQSPRGGRNLTERYRTLENTARGHSELAKQVAAAECPSDVSRPSRAPKPANTLAGFAIPDAPWPPADDECCMSGCAVCVYDVYEASLAAYKESVASLRSALSALHVPESEWPAHARPGREQANPPTDKTKDAVVGAFEDMERALTAKREKRAAVEAKKRARGEVLDGDGLDVRGLYEGIRWAMFPNR